MLTQGNKPPGRVVTFRAMVLEQLGRGEGNKG